MTRVLLVDDDPIVLRIYQRGLTQRGLQVSTAVDGLAAVKAIRQARPDIVVLDLMMPNFSGVEVLKFIRAEKDLADLPVVVLSNAYMTDLANSAASLGAQKALLKVDCSPGLLRDCIGEILGGAAVDLEVSKLVAAAPPSAPAAAPAAPASQPAAQAKETTGPLRTSAPAAPTETDAAADAEFRTQAREDFVKHAPATASSLRQLAEVFKNASSAKERGFALEKFYRKVHFLSSTAGLAGCHSVAGLATALEAMLYQLMDQPGRVNPSVLRTTDMAVEFLSDLLARPGDSTPPPQPFAVLVVDFDGQSNRLVVSALRLAGLQGRSTEDPVHALKLLRERRYDLVLLEIPLAGMDGFELCKRMRALPDYQKIPVIWFTAQTGFEQLVQETLAPGDDLIAKPVLPAELAVKAVMHLLRSRKPSAVAPQ